HQGLADWGARNTELGCKSRLHKAVIWAYLAVHDRVHELFIDLVCKAAASGLDARKGHGASFTNR
ncbi:MAG: hypothetical protein P8Q99_09445, partial [Paracoccaceae bacterium]|nr:hypothetical protein [Paracoccaceae bacterium]